VKLLPCLNESDQPPAILRNRQVSWYSQLRTAYATATVYDAPAAGGAHET